MKKSFIVFALSLFSLSSFAYVERETPIYFTCKQTHTSSPRPLSFVLTQEKVGAMKEGVRTPFILQVFSGEAERPFLTKRVYAVSEDVMFDFATNDKSVSGRIYLDEFDQTSLNIGKNSYRFACDGEQ